MPGSHVVTVYEPLDALMSQYISAIDETRYEENFRKHEAIIQLSYEDIDLNDMFEEAEKMVPGRMKLMMTPQLLLLKSGIYLLSQTEQLDEEPACHLIKPYQVSPNGTLTPWPTSHSGR